MQQGSERNCAVDITNSPFHIGFEYRACHSGRGAPPPSGAVEACLSTICGRPCFNGTTDAPRSGYCNAIGRVRIMKEQKTRPVHPGQILLEDFLKPMGITQNKLALVIGVPPRRINEIVLGKRRISPDTALRLGRYFSTSPQFWLALQTDYDLDIAASKLGDRLKRDIHEYASCS